LINLLSNAMKFTKYKDVPNIEVEGYAERNEHVYYIRDNGVGFDMAYYDKLFGVFQRLHGTEPVRRHRRRPGNRPAHHTQAWRESLG
jgi:light-regulated signal transduction histidine kinase (bacteriophytochrome)